MFCHLQNMPICLKYKTDAEILVIFNMAFMKKTFFLSLETGWTIAALGPPKPKAYKGYENVSAQNYKSKE